MGNTSGVMQDVARDMDCGVIKNEVPRITPVPDPRSPSEEFARTPIEIKHAIRSTNTRSRISQPMESHGALERGSYTRIRLISDDPRSPTPGIVRTPIQVLTPERKYTETDESPISLTSATSEDYETGDDQFSLKDHTPSSLSKDTNPALPDVLSSPKMVEKQPKTIADVFIDEDIPVTAALTCPSMQKQNHNNSENEIRVKLFHTPPAKASGLKVRMPLRAFSANESLPQQILRAKQARGILENMDVENTPPKGIPDTLTRSIPTYLKSFSSDTQVYVKPSIPPGPIRHQQKEARPSPVHHQSEPTRVNLAASHWLNAATQGTTGTVAVESSTRILKPCSTTEDVCRSRRQNVLGRKSSPVAHGLQAWFISSHNSDTGHESL